MGHGPGRQIFRTRFFIVPFHDLSIDAYDIDLSIQKIREIGNNVIVLMMKYDIT